MFQVVMVRGQNAREQTATLPDPLLVDRCQPGLVVSCQRGAPQNMPVSVSARVRDADGDFIDRCGGGENAARIVE
jgi:hypothetical protein